jgi:hypothetical protein
VDATYPGSGPVLGLDLIGRNVRLWTGPPN